MTSIEYFKRQITLWGSEVQEVLAEKKIAIIGAGGLGSSLALALGTSGIGKIDIVDFDTVSIHNIHRQIAFTLADEGCHKATKVAQLIISKNPFVEVKAFEMSFTQFSTSATSYDLILDATDNLDVRKEIDCYAKLHNLPWIYASVEAFNGQVCFFDMATFQVFNTSDHTPLGVATPIVMHIAALQANFALRYLAGLSVEKDILNYLYFNEEGALITQKFGMPKV